MSIEAAVFSAATAISSAGMSVWRTRARAAASAAEPPLPIAIHAVVRLDQVARAREQQRVLAVGDEQQASRRRSARSCRQSRASSIAARSSRPPCCSRTLLEALKQRETLGRAAREAGEDAAGPRGAAPCAPLLHDRPVERHLAIGAIATRPARRTATTVVEVTRITRPPAAGEAARLGPAGA